MKENQNKQNSAWYQKFDKSSKPSKEKKDKAKERFVSTAKGTTVIGKLSKKELEKLKNQQHNNDFPQENLHNELNAKFISSTSMFNQKKLPKDAINILDNFDNIIQGIRPLNTKQLAKLPKTIRNLSHQLTDERDRRHLGYMNNTEELSAYVRYFTWWNLVRLTRLFANMDAKDFHLNDKDYCLDLGSGPLTVVIALWLARPELREKKLTWYCVDISQGALALGEDLYLSIAAKTPPKNESAEPNWNIIRVKGELGVSLKNKVSFITCANMFNELNQKTQSPTDILAKNHINSVLSYTTEKTSIFIAEPGIPSSAHFVSRVRDELISKKFNITAPCPHFEKCPMHGKNAKLGGQTKWCNFAFTTEKAPNRLLKLSNDSGIPKERAVLSFVFANNFEKPTSTDKLRIASDSFWLPGNLFGFYACNSKGLILLVNKSKNNIQSGDLIDFELTQTKIYQDSKSNAKKIVM